MKDNEIRGIVLKRYYELRRRGIFQWAEVDEVDLGADFPRDAVDLFRICDQLGEHGLIEWRPVQNGRGITVGGIGKISAFGVDVVEGTVKPPISVNFVSHGQHIQVSGSSNVQIGNSNTQDIAVHVDQIQSAINQSDASEESKAEAKSLLGDFLKHPAVTAILGGLASSVNK